MDLLILAGAFVLILAGAELFTNGVEWLGRRLDLAEGAVGSVIAAVGTALPETMIPIVAIVLGAQGAGTEVSEGIGIGAILGAPFMLSTLAMFVTGVAVLATVRRRPSGEVMRVDTGVLGRDVRSFGLAYALAIGAAFLPPELSWGKFVVAAVLVCLYALYVRAHLRGERSSGWDNLVPLRFRHLERHRHDREPGLSLISLQVVVALAAIIVGAVAFVGAVRGIAGSVGLDPMIMSLVIAPIATELPEKFNSVIWVRQGKDTLALGNITGAMVFQSCIPTVVALLLATDSWAVTPDSALAFASAVMAFASTAAVFGPMALRGRLTGRGLLVGGIFYVAYLALVVAGGAGLSPAAGAPA